MNLPSMIHGQFMAISCIKKNIMATIFPNEGGERRGQRGALFDCSYIVYYMYTI